MSQPAANQFPYEKQADPKSNRLAGAAALTMVYRSLGQIASQAEIADSASRQDDKGQPVIQGAWLANDALERGMTGLVIQARDPLALLKRRHSSVRFILNHRLSIANPASHFTVLVGLEDDYAILHDPQLGPGIRILQSELLRLWQARPGPGDNDGNVLIAIAPARPVLITCSVCGKTAPPIVPCPSCAKPVVLQPATVIGCANGGCDGRTWQKIYCPSCGTGWSEKPREAGPPRAEAVVVEPETDAPSSDPMEEEVKELCAFLLKLPNGEEVAEWLQGSFKDYKGQPAAEAQAASPPPKSEGQGNEGVATAEQVPGESAGQADDVPTAVQMLRNLGFLQPRPAKPRVAPVVPRPAPVAAQAPPKPEPPPLRDQPPKKLTKKIRIPRADDEYGSLPMG